MPVTINKNLCPQNHPCPAVRICPVEALSQQGFNAPDIDADKCLDCGKCTKLCPMGALQNE
ncbi:MAG: 4Fe-4S binding protein [bacterium]|nr:4Fe-4S binding protein [bacterium]